MSPSAVTERLRRACRSSSLAHQHRLREKLDMSSAGITRRLQKVGALRRLCLELGRIGERNGLVRNASR